MALLSVNSAPVDFDIVSTVNETHSLLDQLKRDYPEISLEFKEWKSQRIKSIDAVQDLLKKLEKVEYSCRVAQGSGAALALAGQVTGLVLCLCGGVTSLSSYFAEMGLTHCVISNVKEVIRKDEELTEPLMKTLKYSRTINHHFVRIFNCSILSDHFTDSVRLCYLCFQLLEEGEMEIQVLIRRLLERDLKDMDISDYTEIVIENVCGTLRNIYRNTRIRSLFRDICDTILSNPFTLKIFQVGLKLSLQICDAAKINVFSGIGHLSALAPGSRCAISNCFLNTIGIASHVVTIVTTVRNFKEQSKNTKMLSDLKLALSMELNAVCRIYSIHFETI
ncbi:uncharacterized protein TNIN_435301 [Trichonephila inaurata madagascariensis]|uniref:Uncharacterized protein n=1 Tax=Trichonephila inaurata madagascariensis TaxID=2747483 RepID=A0A8X6YGI6_9ARAC|nr:uncharacterized protein TNIN_435301 [Trichonephila inaurata madagascariensis]